MDALLHARLSETQSRTRCLQVAVRMFGLCARGSAYCPGGRDRQTQAERGPSSIHVLLPSTENPFQSVVSRDR